MPQRNTALVVVLSMLTCGLYNIYYLYATTNELVAATGRTDVNPGTELLLNVLTCGIWGCYIEYRNQQIIDQWFVQKGIAHEPKAQFVGLMNLLVFFVYVTGYVAVFVYQEELNKLSSAQGGSSGPTTF